MVKVISSASLYNVIQKMKSGFSLELMYEGAKALHSVFLRAEGMTEKK